jgi:predicted GIY-YIG superfamily endonuclease
MPFNSEVLNFNASWNEVAGVYGVLNSQRQMIYIGQTDNFRRRFLEHANDTTHCMHRYGPAYAYAEVIPAQADRDRREREMILEYDPPCNRRVG